MHPCLKGIQFCFNEESFNSHIKKSRYWVSSLNQYVIFICIHAIEKFSQVSVVFHWPLVCSMMELFICKYEPFWQKVSVQSRILCWPWSHVGLLFKKKCKNKNVTKLSISFQTTNVLETPTSRRKIVTLRDSSASMEIKLWGRQIDLLTFQVDQTVLFTCLTVDVYGTRTSLNTNMSTTLEVQQTIYYWFILSLSDLLN